MLATDDELEVLLVRHGETEWNRQGRMQGHQDPSLNDAGAAQAGVVAQFLASGACGEVHGVYSSDLRRAAATAHAIAEQCKPAATSGARRLKIAGKTSPAPPAEGQAMVATAAAALR